MNFLVLVKHASGIKIDLNDNQRKKIDEIRNTRNMLTGMQRGKKQKIDENRPYKQRTKQCNVIGTSEKGVNTYVRTC